jgi:hypothetical protein
MVASKCDISGLEEGEGKLALFDKIAERFVKFRNGKVLAEENEARDASECRAAGG